MTTTDTDKIIQTAAEEYRINPKAIFSKLKLRDVAEARQMCMLIMNRKGYTTRFISNRLERSTDTVLYGIQHIKDLISVDKCVKGRFETINKKLEYELTRK